MTQLKTLYRQIILDHYKKPRNQGLPSDSSYTIIHQNNPSCGDDITVSIKVEDSIITDIKHEGSGCSICCASASIMSEMVKGKSKATAKDLSLEFSKMLLNQAIDSEKLEEAIAFEGVKDFPARIKCATLGWKALESAIKEEEQSWLKMMQPKEK